MKRYFAVVLICMGVTMMMMSPADASRRKAINKIIVLADDLLIPNDTIVDEDSFAQQMERQIFLANNLHVEVKVIGQKGGDTISSMALIPRILAEKPNLVVVVIGYNDALAMTDPDVVYNNLDTLLKELERAGAYVMLVGVEAPVWMEHSYTTKFNNIYPRISQRYHVIYHNGFLKNIQGDPELTLEDRYHPNRQGLTKVVENLMPSINTVIKHIKRSLRYNSCVKNFSKEQCDKFMNMKPKN